MAEAIEWKTVEPGWYIADFVGSVRNKDYRSGGWWFLPHWLPDQAEHDIGPFKTMRAACEDGDRLFKARCAESDYG